MRSLPVICLLPLLLAVSCKNRNKSTAIVPEVNVVEVGRKDVPVYVEYVGQTLGKSDVEIRPRTEGWVQQILFKEGSFVQKGQLLYVLQDDELRDREQGARADLAQAKIMLVKAKADLDRVKPLTEMNALSRRDLDAAQATYDAQQQAVSAAGAALSNANTRLSYARILAPISGTIGISKVQVGDFVKSFGEQPINTISALGELRIRFSITENDYLAFRKKLSPEALKNMEVEFILNDGSVFPETGRLDMADREIDPSTGSLLVQAVVENKSHLLRPGQYVKVRFKSEQVPGAILVPQQAINQMQNIYMVYVVNDSSMISPRPVQVGSRVGSNWIVTQGLQPGEKVALLGNAMVKPGMQIKPVVQPYGYDSTSGSH